MRDAADDDAYGRRHLLGGVFMDLLVLPAASTVGNPRPDSSDQQHRRDSVVPSLEALLWLFVEFSIDASDGVDAWPPFRV